MLWNELKKAAAVTFLGWAQALWPDDDKPTHAAIGAVAQFMAIREKYPL